MRLARYLVNGPVSLERMWYDPETCRVRYSSVKRGEGRDLPGMDFMAELAVHIPDLGEHGVTYRAGTPCPSGKNDLGPSGSPLNRTPKRNRRE